MSAQVHAAGEGRDYLHEEPPLNGLDPLSQRLRRVVRIDPNLPLGYQRPCIVLLSYNMYGRSRHLLSGVKHRSMDVEAEHSLAAELWQKGEAAKECGLDPRLGELLVQHFWEEYDRQLLSPEDTRQTLKILRDAGLADFFDTVVISEREGVRKPDREIFDRALVRCDVEREMKGLTQTTADSTISNTLRTPSMRA